MNRADKKEYFKAYYQAHKAERNAYHKAYREAHRDEIEAYQKAYKKAYYQEHREEQKAYNRARKEKNKDYQKAYRKSDTNSLGQTKNSIRCKSRRYLFTTLRHTKVEGYEIHHCYGYDDYRHFIYIPKELHLEIHQFLRDSNIDADSNHYAQIEHIIINYYKHNDKHFLVL